MCEHGQVAIGESRLSMRDRVERDRRIGDDPLAIARRDFAVLIDPFRFKTAPTHARRGAADLVLWFEVDALRRETAMIDTGVDVERSEEHTSELQSLMRISYAVFCLKKKTKTIRHHYNTHNNPHTKTPYYTHTHRTITTK